MKFQVRMGGLLFVLILIFLITNYAFPYKSLALTPTSTPTGIISTFTPSASLTTPSPTPIAPGYGPACRASISIPMALVAFVSLTRKQRNPKSF